MPTKRTAPQAARAHDRAASPRLPVAHATPAGRAAPLRVQVPKSRQRALVREYGLDAAPVSDAESLQRRESLKALVRQGRARGYLVLQEICDQLPEVLADAEMLEAIVGLLAGVGITVYDASPDETTLLVTGGQATAASEDEAEAGGEDAASAVEGAFGRTTDPVRLYMRGVGAFDLLTRQGEVEIAKRIEAGLQDMLLAVTSAPNLQRAVAVGWSETSLPLM